MASLRKLSHDVSNALVSTVSLFDLAMADYEDDLEANLPAGLRSVRQNLSAPRAIFDAPMRTLPTRSLQRPRQFGDWQIQVQGEAAKLGCTVTLETGLPAPPIEPADWVQCLDNVVQNALDSREITRRCGDLATHGRVAITALHDGDWSGVVVADNGSETVDLASAAAGRLRRNGHGHLGLGLPVAALHLAEVGGQVRLAQGSHGGIRVELRWPLGLSQRP